MQIDVQRFTETCTSACTLFMCYRQFVEYFCVVNVLLFCSVLSGRINVVDLQQVCLICTSVLPYSGIFLLEQIFILSTESL